MVRARTLRILLAMLAFALSALIWAGRDRWAMHAARHGGAAPPGPRRGVRLPDGTPVGRAAPDFRATGLAIAATDEVPKEFWRSFPVRVTVRVKGYERLEFEYRLDRAPVERVLKRERP